MKPKVVCLCGSTRFRDAFEAAMRAETLAGRIVLTVKTCRWCGKPRHRGACKEQFAARKAAAAGATPPAKAGPIKAKAAALPDARPHRAWPVAVPVPVDAELETIGRVLAGWQALSAPAKAYVAGRIGGAS